ncbi:acyloxyacyl hydrolase [Microvirga subterranea]|uniref:Lipid A 3-O-deacylase PagL n=1 Tax=Microvirga subterranea TaxID=186651 RepID=A0A370HI40_9HYPH|nr:acyloxyacyl hydrolase [Microvirga subterranea]RDI57774.1 lipid A 3-O-deacylase PagL [Microvirga subterranea]
MNRLLAMIGGVLALGPAAQAADLGPVGSPTAPGPGQAQPAFLSEVRLGLSAHDPGGPESGTANLTGEILSVRPFTFANPDLDLLVPRLHLGGSLNFSGRTSFAYAGLTWTFDITPSIFIEGSLGGAVHNGETDPIPAHHDALGCTALFRESGSLGVRVSENWSVMATVEHLSNAGLCSNNRGLTNVGLRVGYTF